MSRKHQSYSGPAKCIASWVSLDSEYDQWLELYKQPGGSYSYQGTFGGGGHGKATRSDCLKWCREVVSMARLERGVSLIKVNPNITTKISLTSSDSPYIYMYHCLSTGRKGSVLGWDRSCARKRLLAAYPNAQVRK